MINAIFLFLAIAFTIMFQIALVVTVIGGVAIIKNGEGTIKLFPLYIWGFLAALCWTLFFAL